MTSDTPIQHVTDTALWVANYRAEESERPDALFHDPLAKVLLGERGREISERMDRLQSTHVRWSVVIRTCLIDDYIQDAISQGVDVVLNLGAGLDTRPYRMDLPQNLRWIEVDYPAIIELKEERLKDQTPKCKLERVKLDLAQVDARREFFSRVNGAAKKVLVLTEGVVLYIPENEVAILAEDLKAQSHFQLWIVDYFSKRVMQYMKRSKINERMRNAPFVFDPQDWKNFFNTHGWKLKEMKYTMKEGLRLKRPPPTPFIYKVISAFLPKKQIEEVLKSTGYALLEPQN